MRKRMLSVLLALVLVLTVPASALTAEQAREVLETYYIDEVPGQALAQDTIEGMLDALGDPYTEYFTAEEFAAYMATMEDTEIVGIGITSYYLPEGMLLSAVASDSPAAEAGLRPGDYIIAVDGHDTRGAGEEEINSWILGEEGTSAVLTIQRGEGTFSVTVTRRPVVFHTAELEKIEDRVGWIACTAFGSTTFADFYDIITAHDDEVDMWVVDLRGNGGGDVMAAAFSAGCFAGTDAGVLSRDRAGNYTAWTHDPAYIVPWGYYDGSLAGFGPDGRLTDSAVLVLVDEYTASASELFASSIRDSGAGLIIGGRTYGKGVMQTLFTQEIAPEYFEPGDPAEYFDQGDALKVTTERVYSLQGSTHDLVGILPHLMVEPDLADEVAALLAAPVGEGEDALTVKKLNAMSATASSFIIPLAMLEDPAYADAADQLLSALRPGAQCILRVGGAETSVTPAQAAEAVGASYDPHSFTDTAGSPYEGEIGILGAYGILSGPGDGSFRPEEGLDRASLCALLAKALRYPAAEGDAPFADVPADAWYAPYVAALYEQGILTGDDDGLFHPDDPVDHQQFVVILARVAEQLDMEVYELAREDGQFGGWQPSEAQLAAQYGAFSDWARQSAWLIDWSGIGWTDLKQGADPQAATTRAEAAAALYNLFYVSGVINV